MESCLGGRSLLGLAGPRREGLWLVGLPGLPFTNHDSTELRSECSLMCLKKACISDICLQIASRRTHNYINKLHPYLHSSSSGSVVSSGPRLLSDRLALSSLEHESPLSIQVVAEPNIATTAIHCQQCGSLANFHVEARPEKPRWITLLPWTWITMIDN